MKLFATRVWGYDPAIWPLATFGTEGVCNNLLRASSPGDMIAFVGTKGAPTSKEEQGRILGYAEFGRDTVDTLSVLDADTISPEAYDEHGNFRWPRGIVLTRAWQIKKPTSDLVETIGRQLPYNATTMAVELTGEEREKIFELPCSEIKLVGSKAYQEIRRRTKILQGGGRSKGPSPSDRQGGGYQTGQISYTYVVRFGKTECFKVGFTTDLNRRLHELNAHVPFELLKQKWQPYLSEQHVSEALAHEMEQHVLDAVPQEGITGERFITDAGELDVIWARCLMETGKENT